MGIKLVAVDLDDTLLDKTNVISPRTSEVIRRAIAQGVIVTVATGRMYRSSLPFARSLGLDVPLITYNGALVKCALSGETLLHRPVEPETAEAVLKLFRSRGWHIQIYVDDVLYVETLNDKARWYEQHAKVEAVAVGEKLYTMGVAPTKMLAMLEPGQSHIVTQTLREMFGMRLSLAGSKPNFVEVTHPEANKGKALAFLAAKLKLERAEVMAVGDSSNDLDMIEYAGLGVAMGNAVDAVKAAAQAVTVGNDEDGVAEAIEKYVLSAGS